MSVPRLVVVGSVNLDMRVHVVDLPEPGATVLGTGLTTSPGGKGANQAVAAARLGAAVSFIGSVGSDAAGVRLRSALEDGGVSTACLAVTQGPSGLAIIEVDARGQNRIVVIAGANQAVKQERLAAGTQEADMVKGADVVLLQLEVPVATVREAAAVGRTAGALVVLNAAPATPLTAQDLADIDVLVVNEVEAAALLASLLLVGESQTATAVAPAAAAALLTSAVPTVVITLGVEGSVWAERGTAMWPVRHAGHRAGTQAAYQVKAVDTTGAGDTFVGALGVRLGAGDDLPAALRYASAAAALSTTGFGAQEAIPHAAAVEALMADGTGDQSVA